MTEPIFLCGMMGSGKTTVGKLLATRLVRSFKDLDHEIESAAGRSIPAIFSRFGESHFRKLEREQLKEILSERDSVVALGGGALQDQELIDQIKAAGILIFLDASLSVLLSRLGKDTGRPLLDKRSFDDRSDQLKQLHQKRLPDYRQADIAIQTEGKKPDEIVREITNRLIEKGYKNHES